MSRKFFLKLISILQDDFAWIEKNTARSDLDFHYFVGDVQAITQVLLQSFNAPKVDPNCKGLEWIRGEVKAQDCAGLRRAVEYWRKSDFQTRERRMCRRATRYKVLTQPMSAFLPRTALPPKRKSKKIEIWAYALGIGGVRIVLGQQKHDFRGRGGELLQHAVQFPGGCHWRKISAEVRINQSFRNMKKMVQRSLSKAPMEIKKLFKISADGINFSEEIMYVPLKKPQNLDQ